MRLIAHFDQHELGFATPEDTETTYARKAARAVLMNTNRQIAIMHFAKTGSYKLPGGGIDEGEATEAALCREVREETGWEITDIRELGVIEEDRYYCGMHQTSYCFTATVTQFVGTELTEKEAAQGMELVWVDTIEQAITAVEGNSELDEGGDRIGHDMMVLREVTILNAAKAQH